MNRRQPATPPRPPQQQQQQQRQQRQPQQQASVKQTTPSTQYNPNSANRQLPAQVTIPQAISILVARINQLEDKCAIKIDDTTVDDSKQMEEMSARIVKLELELLSAKDHIMKLQSFTLEIAKPQVIQPTI
jgi:hypothetical protein